MVTITIDGSVCRIDAPEAVIRKVSALLSYRAINSMWIREVREGRWDGIYRLLTKKGHKFQLGLLYRVLLFLSTEGIPFNVVDNRRLVTNFQYSYADLNRVLFVGENGEEVKLRDVQREAIMRYCSEYYGLYLGRGIFSMPPRSGKTIMASVLGQVLNEYPISFVVHKIDIALQTKRVFEKVFKEKVGLVGDGNYDVSDCRIIVSTIQSINRAFDIKDNYEEEEKDTGHYDEIREFISGTKVLFIDECHVAGASTFQELPKYLRNVLFIAGFSGTPSRDSGDDLLIEQLCGTIIHHLPKTVAVEKGYVLPCVIYTVDLPGVKVLSSSYASQEKYGVNTNPYVLDAVERIVKRLEKRNLSCVINVRKVEQGKAIQKRIGCPFLHGAVPGSYREEIYEKLNKKEILTIVSTVTDLGVDIPSLNVVILARVTMSKVSSFQWIRCNTPFRSKKYGYVFLLCPTIDGVERDYLKKHGNMMKRLYKKEPTFTVIGKNLDEL